MAGNKYIDANGDFSRYLQMSDLGSHLFSASSEPEGSLAPTIAVAGNHQAAPEAFDFLSLTVGGPHHQAAPPAFDFLSLTVGGPYHRAPATVAVPPAQMPPPEQAAHGFRDATLGQGSGSGGSSGINGMLTRTVIRSPASPSLHDQIIKDRKKEHTAFARRVQTGNAAEFDESHSHGHLHERENNEKAHFAVHGSDQGKFQHAIIGSMHNGADSHAPRGDSLYHDLSKRMHEWVQSFKASGVERVKTDNSGRLKDTWPGLCVTNYADISVLLLTNDGQKEVEVGRLNKTLSAPATNEAASDSSQPNVAMDTPEAFDWTGFHPAILESSQVPPYDGASGTSATIYPSLYDKLQDREQARHAKLSTDGASEISQKKMSKRRKKDCTKDPNLSSASFKLLCRKDKTFRKHSSRINELNRRIRKLEENATTAGSGRQCYIKSRMEKYKQEKAQLLDTIKKGLEQIENGNNGAGTSG